MCLIAVDFPTPELPMTQSCCCPVPTTLPCVYNYQTATSIFGKVIALPVIEAAAGKGKSAHKGGKGNDFLQDALHLGMIRKCGDKCIKASFCKFGIARILHFITLATLSARRQAFLNSFSSLATGITSTLISPTVSPSLSICMMIFSPSSAAFSARCLDRGSFAPSASPLCCTTLLDMALISVPLSTGLKPIDTKVLGMFVSFESHSTSTFCGYPDDTVSLSDVLPDGKTVLFKRQPHRRHYVQQGTIYRCLFHRLRCMSHYITPFSTGILAAVSASSRWV